MGGNPGKIALFIPYNGARPDVFPFACQCRQGKEETKMRKDKDTTFIDHNRLITATELGRLLGVHPSTVKRNAKANPKFPRPIRLCGDRDNAPLRFSFADVQAFLQTSKIGVAS